jgi:hypothetical protein
MQRIYLRIVTIMGQVMNFGNFPATALNGDPIWVKRHWDHPDSPLFERMQREQAALDLVNAYDDELAPATYPERFAAGVMIGMERLSGLGKVSLQDRLDLVERLHALPIGGQLDEIATSDDYTAKTSDHVRTLVEAGAIRGATQTELDGPIRRMQHRQHSAGYFGLAPTHTDAQKRHFGWVQNPDTGQPSPRLIDWEQLHLGPELADFAFMSIRHPMERRAIMAHLQAHFEGQGTLQHKLPAAMAFLETHMLIKGMYDRVVQSHGTPKDHVLRMGGRAMLHSGLIWRNLGWRPETIDPRVLARVPSE